MNIPFFYVIAITFIQILSVCTIAFAEDTILPTQTFRFDNISSNEKELANSQTDLLFMRHHKNHLYFEAWIEANHVIERRGTVGTKGIAKKHPFETPQQAQKIFSQILKQAHRLGFKQLPNESFTTLVVQYHTTNNLDHDFAKRDRVEEFVGSIIVDLGFGYCDGASIGSGSMEVFCSVLDYTSAKKTLIRRLSKTSLRDYKNIGKLE